MNALKSLPCLILTLGLTHGLLASCQGSGGTRDLVVPEGTAATNALLKRADEEFTAKSYQDALETYTELHSAARSKGLKKVAAEAAAQIATCYAVMGQSGEGDPWLEKAEADASEQDVGAYTRILLAQGVRSWRAFEVDRARGMFIYLYNYSLNQNRTPRAVQAAQMAALASRGQEQLDWMMRSIEGARTTGDPALEAPLWTEYGVMFDQRERFDEALDAFANARRLTAQASLPRLVRERTDWQYAHGLRMVGRFDDARNLLEETNAIVHSNYIERPSPQSAELLGRVLAEIGEVDAAEGRFDRAKERMLAAREKLLEAGSVQGAQIFAKTLEKRIENLGAPAPIRKIPPKQRPKKAGNGRG